MVHFVQGRNIDGNIIVMKIQVNVGIVLYMKGRPS